MNLNIRMESSFLVKLRHRLPFVVLLCLFSNTMVAQQHVYHITRLDSFEERMDSVTITNYLGEMPVFKPKAIATLRYDDHHLFLHFSVADRHVFYNVTDYNGPVSKDACVEFFFAPDVESPTNYFNLEINVGGTALMRYNGNGRVPIAPSDFEAVEITRSLILDQGQVIDDSVTWQIRCKIPLDMLKKYASITWPRSGVKWRGNFYKTASTGKNKHWMAWSTVESETPNFHLPEYFGSLIFD